MTLQTRPTFSLSGYMKVLRLRFLCSHGSLAQYNKMFPFEAMLLFVLQLHEQIMHSFSDATPGSKEPNTPIYITTRKYSLFSKLLCNRDNANTIVCLKTFYFHIFRCHNTMSNPMEFNLYYKKICFLTGNQGLEFCHSCGDLF